MGGTDRYDAGVALLSALVCVVGVSELARQLGASKWAQVVAAVICATIPTGILLATDTENDSVAAAISLALLVVVAAFEFRGAWKVRSLVLGVVAGLTYMTKGTIPLMIGPAALALVLLAARRDLRRTGVGTAIGQVGRRAGGAVVGAAIVAAPFLGQNVQLFGALSGPVSRSTVDLRFSFDGSAANIVRMTAANFDIGNGQSGLSTNVARIVLGDFTRCTRCSACPFTTATTRSRRAPTRSHWASTPLPCAATTA